MDDRLCPRCRFRSADPRRKWCQICYQDSLVDRVKSNAGTLCEKSCGRAANPGKTLCEMCYQKVKSDQKPQRSHPKPPKNAGTLCEKSCGRAANPGKTLCEMCYQKVRQQRPRGHPRYSASATSMKSSTIGVAEFSLPPIQNTPPEMLPPPEGNPHILFVGNPGAGKSTLLNSLLRTVVFHSGYSVVVGLTTHLQAYTTDAGVTYLDTPGLSDFEKRKQAAAEITQALQKDGQYILFFVVTLEGGRVKADDATTMQLVLNALSAVQHLSFSIVINRVSGPALEKLKEETNYKYLLASINANLPVHTDRLFFYPLENDAVDCDDVLVDQNNDFLKFVWRTQPVLIKTEQVVPINAETFDEVKQQMKMITESLVEDKEKLEQLLQLVQKEKAEREDQLIKEREERERELKRATEEREAIVAALNEVNTQMAANASRIAKAEAEVTARTIQQEAERQQAEEALRQQEAQLKLAAERAQQLQEQLTKQELDRQQREADFKAAVERERQNQQNLVKETWEAAEKVKEREWKTKLEELEQAKEQEARHRKHLVDVTRQSQNQLDNLAAELKTANTQLNALLREKAQREGEARQKEEELKRLQMEQEAKIAAEKQAQEAKRIEQIRLQNRPWRHTGQLCKRRIGRV